jgi:hypothetical protein
MSAPSPTGGFVAQYRLRLTSSTAWIPSYGTAGQRRSLNQRDHRAGRPARRPEIDTPSARATWVNPATP